MVKVICDNKQLIYSNRLCCISRKSIALKVKLTESTIMDIVFEFVDEDEEFKTYVHSPENGKVVFRLSNYNSSLGSGIKEPVQVGELDGKKIFIVFYVYRLTKESLPILDVSLYMEV